MVNKLMDHTKTDHRKDLLDALEQNRKEFADILAELEKGNCKSTGRKAAHQSPEKKHPLLSDQEGRQFSRDISQKREQ